jgi:hypothetical protein
MSELIADGPVERHLDELFNRLSGTGAAGRRSMSEAEEHLRDAMTAGLAAGMPQVDAERAAVARFGSSARLAAELQVTHRPIGSLIRPAGIATWWIGIIASLSFGVAGLLTYVLGKIQGVYWIVDDRPADPTRCAEYLRLEPSQSSCDAAATAHHFGELVRNGIVAALVGLLALGAWLLMRRRIRGARPAAWLVALITAALAGVTGAGLLYMSLPYVDSYQVIGLGWKLANGSVAVAVALGALLWALRLYRRPRPVI